ncbi:sugar phosphate isomerase/epimerase family protein [Paenibacillus sp. TAF58]
MRSVVQFADKTVGLCVDTGWAHVAGCDPIAWVKLYPERIKAFHLRNQRGRVPVEDVTEGEIDISALLEAAAHANYGGWIALELWHPPETNPTRTMTENVQRSIAFLREIVAKL